MIDRAALETNWLTLTRETLPALAVERNWPIRADHCFQRVLFDNAVGGCWYDHIAGRPAYRQASDGVLKRAIALARAIIASDKDLPHLNRGSLGWRRNRRITSPRSGDKG